MDTIRKSDSRRGRIAYEVAGLAWLAEASGPGDAGGGRPGHSGGGHADRGRHVVGGLPGGRAHRLLPGRAPRPHERDAHPPTTGAPT